jgi:glutamate-ammonia-ligase adenylyltransferase
VEPAAKWLIDALRRGHADADGLAAAGLDAPADLAEALAAAETDAHLRGALELWVPPILHAAEPLFAVRTLRELVIARRGRGAPLDLARLPALPLVLGASRFLARRLIAHPDWIDELAGSPPAAPAAVAIPRDWDAIRTAKYRGLLRIAARDLLGRPFEASLAELSDLADRCLTAALGCAEDETGSAPPSLLALGKLGGRELNFSSDVDLLFLYPTPADADAEARAVEVARLVRSLKANLEQPAEEGFGYRVDLDLRPEGRAGVVANPLDVALAYYESYGLEWERQMLIRLRPVAGPADVALQFRAGIQPFVYRRLIGPDVMRAVYEMKQRVEADRRDAGHDLDACLKEGPGGIRDVEFLVQAFQLLHGGREPALRSGNVLDTLAELSRLALLPEASALALRDAYLWLRRAEHALQLAEEQQVSRVPRAPAARSALARRMGYREASAELARSRMLDDWTAVRSSVRSHFDALVLGRAE